MEAKHRIGPAIAVLLAVGGIHILTEVVRPFRDLRSDGLLAAGLVLAICGLVLGWGRAWRISSPWRSTPCRCWPWRYSSSS